MFPGYHGDDHGESNNREKSNRNNNNRRRRCFQKRFNLLLNAYFTLLGQTFR